MDNKLLKYIPKKFIPAIKDIYHDEDGYWIYLNENYHVRYYFAEFTIHEDTIKELIRVVRKIEPIASSQIN